MAQRLSIKYTELGLHPCFRNVKWKYFLYTIKEFFSLTNVSFHIFREIFFKIFLWTTYITALSFFGNRKVFWRQDMYGTCHVTNWHTNISRCTFTGSSIEKIPVRSLLRAENLKRDLNRSFKIIDKYLKKEYKGEWTYVLDSEVLWYIF